jgi:NET1-associated nuclear protein 1 (U3 small nucleolar RNA-associated protein 17)
MPHDDHITALCFCNTEKTEKPLTLVTASKDGHFKVWILADDSDIYRKLTKHVESIYSFKV